MINDKLRLKIVRVIGMGMSGIHKHQKGKMNVKES